jgi:UDP-2-acetamido-3-amino-2,3-dideoxy-glucuronate N-acetyltransferase
MSIYVDPSAEVSQDAEVKSGSKIWANAQIRSGAVIGHNCIVGTGAYIDSNVRVGENSKIQNYALIYEPAIVESGVFIGPGATLTNDQYPRAINPDGSRKTNSDWNPVGVLVRSGASIGAGAICVAPVEIGEWAVVAAGAVVTRNVAKFALVAGIPAVQIGWVGTSGYKLLEENGKLVCPKSKKIYQVSNEQLEEVIDL